MLLMNFCGLSSDLSSVMSTHQVAAVTPVRNAAAILLFSPPYLSRSTGAFPRRDTTQLCHSKDTGGTIRRVGRARRHHIATNQPRHEFARFRRQHSSAGSAATGTRANLATDNVDKTPGVRQLATDAD